MSKEPDKKKKLDDLRRKLNRQRGEVINWMTELESELDDIIIGVYIKPEFQPVFLDALLWEDFRLATKIKLFEALPIVGEGKNFQSKVVAQLRKLSSKRNKFAHRISLITSDGTYLIDKDHRPYPVTDEDMEKFREEAKDTLAALKAVAAVLDKHTLESIQKGELRLIALDDIAQAIKSKIGNSPDQVLFSTKKQTDDQSM
jgi:hypothetical protein